MRLFTAKAIIWDLKILIKYQAKSKLISLFGIIWFFFVLFQSTWEGLLSVVRICRRVSHLDPLVTLRDQKCHRSKEKKVRDKAVTMDS